MNRKEAWEYVRGQLKSYLSSEGINTRKKFLCLNPSHDDHDPSMSFDQKRNKVHCFACDADYDTFDLIGIDYRLTDKADIFRQAYEHFNINVESERPSCVQDFSRKYQKESKTEHNMHNGIHTNTCAQQVEKRQQDYTEYFIEVQKHIKETDYPKRRGLTEETTTRYKLGYDSNFRRATDGKVWKALIIPTGRGSFTARNTAEDADKKDRLRKQGESPIYNFEAIKTAQKPIFVVEGELDALSVIDVGGEAIALGSTTNTQRLLNLLKQEKPLQPLIISLDNDNEGQKATDELIKGLQEFKVSFYRLNIAGENKDANDALQADREGFRATIQSAENIEKEALEAERETYLKTSAINYLQGFIDGIAESVNTPHIPTGFGKLDETLDGGLFEGLYIVGAISSLGKTTLVAQIADQIADYGKDVLYFSLEMARTEIMAKSISRLTLLQTLSTDRGTCNAKTSRGITTGTRYSGYSSEERKLIDTSIKAYGEYAGRIYISEGIGDIGVKQIREEVERHIHFTGNKPVVVIDYIQILAPYNDRSTDKQNIDKATMELKRISRDCKIPVIGISSFNRQSYKEKVTMESFKESGAIEYSSDVLIGLQLKGVGADNFNVDAEKVKNPRNVELVILKNRNGATGKKIEYEYYPLFNYFQEDESFTPLR